MPSLTLLTLLALLAGADGQDGPRGCVPLDGEVVYPALVPGQPAPPGAAVPPRGAWWHGAQVPVAYQQHVYYPTWDMPLWIVTGHPPLGVLAGEVPQRPCAPAFWKPLCR